MMCKQNKKASFDYYIDYNIIEKFYLPLVLFPQDSRISKEHNPSTGFEWEKNTYIPSIEVQQARKTSMCIRFDRWSRGLIQGGRVMYKRTDKRELPTRLPEPGLTLTTLVSSVIFNDRRCYGDLCLPARKWR